MTPSVCLWKSFLMPCVPPRKVLYTKGAMCSAAGFQRGGRCTVNPVNLAYIEGIINLAVAETNKAYELSGVPTKLRLVKTHFDASYNDYTNDWDSTIDFLRGNGDGKLDYVHSMRDQYGADFVSMLVDTGGYCGVGYVPLTPNARMAFSLVQWDCATGYYSFGHEIGHNMGCNHQTKNPDEGQSNYGYQDPGARFRSILAYDCSPSCPRLLRFSNPNIKYNGLPTGSFSADNAAHIRNNLLAYANFRQSVASDDPPTPQPSPKPTPQPTRQPTPHPMVAVIIPLPTVAPPTPAPTLGFVSRAPVQSSSTLSLTAPFKGGVNGAAGNMFDIRAAKNLSVTNFAVHAGAASLVTVEIYKKKTVGRFLGTQFNSTQWAKIGQATFESKALGNPSILPMGTFAPVFVKAGVVQAFYVTFTQATNLNVYTTGSTYGAVQVSNGDLAIRYGYANKYRFGQDFSPRAWNGILYYQTAASTALTVKGSSPSLAPTRIPAGEADQKQISAHAQGALQNPLEWMLP